MHIVILIVAVILILFWLQAEAKQVRPICIWLGLASLVTVALWTYELASITPGHESTYHRGIMRRTGEFLAKGDTNALLEAVQAYNVVAATGSTHQASLRMLTVLRRHDRQN